MHLREITLTDDRPLASATCTLPETGHVLAAGATEARRAAPARGHHVRLTIAEDRRPPERAPAQLEELDRVVLGVIR